MSLHEELFKFRTWALSFPDQNRSGEWECDYEAWGELRLAVSAFLASSNPNNWTKTEIADLLYAIARDNEVELLAEKIAENVGMLLAISAHSIACSEHDAKWQLAAQLGNVSERTQEAENILLELFTDEDEYVSRRALLSLGTLKSSSAERLAEQAWATGHEYQRMAALSVFNAISSPKLSEYVAKAIADGRDYVVQRAHEVQHPS